MLIILIAGLHTIKNLEPPENRFHSKEHYGPPSECWKDYYDKPEFKTLDFAMAKYPDFAEIVKKELFKLPELNSMVPQGITTIDNRYIIITAYDSRKITPSKCYVLDTEGNLLNTAILESASHVGGIAYDRRNDLIWIPGIGDKLNAYASSDIIENESVQAKHSINLRRANLEDKDSIDYLFLEDEYIYTGTFSKVQNGQVDRYKIENSNQKIELSLTDTFEVPSFIQGMTIYRKEKENYLILSSSYGRHNASKLYTFKFDETLKDYSNTTKCTTKTLPPMLEQITIKGSKLLVIFESNAKKYHDCRTKVESVVALNIEKIVGKE